MSHDSEAAYASSEIADIISQNQRNFFGSIGSSGVWSVYSGREGDHKWPLADGVIFAENTVVPAKKMAFEFKRPNEGVHGILTALGQSFAYLEKGYDASIIVIPECYTSHSEPGQHIKRVIDLAAPTIPIAIYTYSQPDLSATRPFFNRLSCIREIDLSQCTVLDRDGCDTVTNNFTTLWAHMREGMSHPDAFFRYCQAVKIASVARENLSEIILPEDLREAVQRKAPNCDPFKYLSNTAGDTIADIAWRYTWFNFYFHNELIPIYNDTTTFSVNETPTKIKIDADKFQNLFSGRVDSIKNKLSRELQNSHSEQDIKNAWEQYAAKVRSDAHSYREVIDSGLYHIGFLAADGYLTELGYKFVEACERTGISYDGYALEILRSAILQNGQYGALLHYFYKLSQDKFQDELFAFSKKDSSGQYTFDKEQYIEWIDDIFANELHISKKTTIRAGSTRKPLQAELALLKKMGFVKSAGRGISYRVGVGLDIDWPRVESSMLFFQSLNV